MIKVILAETAKELFQLNMSQAPSIGDELMLNDEPYLITGRRFVIEGTERDTKNVNNTILYVERVQSLWIVCFTLCNKKADQHCQPAFHFYPHHRRTGWFPMIERM